MTTRTRSLLFATLVIGATLMVALGVSAFTGRNVAATEKSDLYCWGKMAPASADIDQPPILSESCFNDEGDALNFRAADAVYTHFTIYRDANFGGGWYKFEHTYFGGASLRITGFQSTLGVLDDASSSWIEP
ncbi:MAG: hypothetical protein AB7J35_06835 [Dehalococcoidia bacterium]